MAVLMRYDCIYILHFLNCVVMPFLIRVVFVILKDLSQMPVLEELSR